MRIYYNSMINCVRILEFDSAHRVMLHESKCRNLHGHRYKVEVFATAKELDSLGRIIDFSVIKQKLGTWLDDNWDHTSIINAEDTETIELLNKIDRNKDIYVMPCNPTAENMALYLLNDICPKLFSSTGITVNKIKVWETPNCFAEVCL